VGGGALVAPALYIILGMTYTEAVAASLVYSVFTKIVGFVQHQRQGTVLWRMALLYGLPAIPGAVIGSQLLYAFESAERLFALAMSGVLVLVAVFLLLEANLRRLGDREKPFDPAHVGVRGTTLIAAIAFAVGVLLGVTSIGSGSIIILTMVLLFRMSARQVVGTNIAIALVMVIPAGLTHFAAGGVRVPVLLLLLLGSAVGTVLGSRATMIVPDRALKIVMGVLILISAIATVLRAW
jgi:uncharacterized membrane protein YfcA